MMVALLVCSACRRHVRSSETSCPFCNAPREPTFVAEPAPVRLSRAASFVLHMLLGASATSGCASATPPTDIAATKESKPVPSASVAPAPSVSASASASATPPASPGGTVAIYGSPAIMIVQRVSFDIGSAVVSKDAEPMLEAIAEVLSSRPKWYLAIEPRAETAEGKDASARLALAKKRGEAIAAKLVHFGLDPKRLRVKPLGDTQPITVGKTKEERAHNRSTSFRVELEDGSPAKE